MNVTLSVLAERTQIDASQLRRLVKSAFLRATRIGARYFVEEAEVERLLRWRDAKSITKWRQEGRRVKKGQEPVGRKHGRVGNPPRWIEFDVFHEDQTEPMRRSDGEPAESISVLAAVWCINRYAKRCRDAARGCYESGCHGFAVTWRRRKEEAYRLKSQALHYLLEEGSLQRNGYHRIGELWSEVIAGNGYCFHRPCPPPQLDPEQVKVIDQIEAKPKGTHEPRLKDALHTLEQYLAGKPTVAEYSWPAPTREVRMPCLRAWQEERNDEEYQDSHDEEWDF